MSPIVGQALATVGASLALAIVFGLFRVALIVRDTQRETKELTRATAELRKDWADDHERLGAVIAQLWPHEPGRHSYGRTNFP